MFSEHMHIPSTGEKFNASGRSQYPVESTWDYHGGLVDEAKSVVYYKWSLNAIMVRSEGSSKVQVQGLADQKVGTGGESGLRCKSIKVP